MGRSFVDCYPDLWPSIKPFFDKCRHGGVGLDYSPEQALIVERKGWREE